MSEHHDLLRRSFGLDSLRPHQQRAWEALRERRDVLVVLSTGGGKSLCYQFPAVAGMAPALVVSPLVALMKDQVDALQRRGIAAAGMTGALSASERERVWESYEAGGIALLYLAPEALENRRTIERLSARPPQLLAIDEAHCIFEWGESFRPSYLRLGAVRETLGHPPTIALTATATARTQRDIIDRLALQAPERILSGFDRPNLSFEVETVPDEATRLRRLSELAGALPGSAVFYAPTRRRTEALAAHLRRAGLQARAYHAGLPSSERAEVQDAFLVGAIPAIVATCAFGMGVDKPDVRLVVHAAPPPTLESYYQEAGRAGRDGAPGRCIALLAPRDVADARQRLGRAIPGLVALHRIYSLVRDAQRRGLEAPLDIRRLASALALPATEVERGIAMLITGGYLATEAAPRALLRLLANSQRLDEDSTLHPADVAFVQRAAALVSGSEGARLVARRDLAALEPELALDERLRRVQAAQLLSWIPPVPTLRCALPWDEPDLLRIRGDEERRVRRDLWRFDAVARFLTTPRCRRIILLRYFGDEWPQLACGKCDRCHASPATASGSPVRAISASPGPRALPSHG